MENEIPYNRDVTYFAKTNFRSTDEIFGIKRKDRRQHMYVLGKSGSGKSVLLSNLIVQDIRNGEGVCVVDPHGELVEEILHLIPEERAKDVIYFNPADADFHVGFNVIQLDDPKYKHLVASGLMGIFTKIWANAWSSRMEYILNNTILALLDTPNTTMLGIQRMLVDKDYRQMIINNLKDPVVKAFWIHEYEQWRDQFRNEAIAPIQNKVGQFLSTSIIRNVVGQPKSTIDIFKIMNEGKIFLVNVSKGRIGEDNSALLGGMIITKIQLATMERVRIPENERRDFYLYVDEFQNFATDSFANILSEARKYRLSLTVAHQYTAQLETKEGGSKVRDSVFGNVGTMMIFRVGADDADFLEKEFEPEFTAQDLVNLPNYHIYLKLMIDGVTSRPFSAATLPPLKVDLSLGVKERIIETSRKLYTRPREEVEDEIEKWSGMLQMSDGESKYKADCSNCTKITMVPFEPKEGRPVYCKECLYKIKNGDLEPGAGFTVSRSSSREGEIESSGSLSMLGIEFKTDESKKGSAGKKSNNENNNENKEKSSNFKGKNNKTRTSFKNRNEYPKTDKKRSGPSPLLKGLLKKIGVSGDKEGISNQKNPEITEVKIKSPEPISLSALEKSDTKGNVKKEVAPVKEASEEKKASLKDLLSKIEDTKNISSEKEVEEKIIPTIETLEMPPVPEPVIESVAPEKMPPVTKESTTPEETHPSASLLEETPPAPDPEPAKIEVKKEIPIPEPVVETEEIPQSLPTQTRASFPEEKPSAPEPIKPEITDEMLDQVKFIDEETVPMEETKKADDPINDKTSDIINSWHKKNPGKEVPEEVLRKILEE